MKSSKNSRTTWPSMRLRANSRRKSSRKSSRWRSVTNCLTSKTSSRMLEVTITSNPFLKTIRRPRWMSRNSSEKNSLSKTLSYKLTWKREELVVRTRLSLRRPRNSRKSNKTQPWQLPKTWRIVTNWRRTWGLSTMTRVAMLAGSMSRSIAMRSSWTKWSTNVDQKRLSASNKRESRGRPPVRMLVSPATRTESLRMRSRSWPMGRSLASTRPMYRRDSVCRLRSMMLPMKTKEEGSWQSWTKSTPTYASN